MVTRRGTLKIAGAAGIATVLITPGRAVAAHPAAGTWQAALDAMVTAGAVGVLAEVHDRAGVWIGSSGTARLGSEQPVPRAGLVRAGSITKSFVATVVLQLAGHGRLHLDDAVQRYLPGLLPDGARITLRDLLQHTSGLHDYTRTDAFAALYEVEGGVERMRSHTWQPQDLIALVADRPLLFEPGTDWRYVNTNFLLLGMVIERVTGSDYRAEIRRRVLRPLGLDRTAVPGTDPYLHGPHPHGYVPTPEPIDVSVYNPSVAGAAGELVSCPHDLNVFFRALVGGRLLPPAVQQQMLAYRTTPVDYDYGLGVMTRVLPGGTRLWGHRGDFLGAYWTETWVTEPGGRQLTVSMTPWGDVNPKAVISAFAATVIEGTER
ncbi:serine hydrolase [Actinoplanes sp. L3-i22]|uniref:serine hydrolase domain-containing protein n=1 Tax=Actinoplanes sp. L3-i22 TaxID=2836373 RepID=UPI001C789CD5|nr:serine hydrolase domain-containing protein [Actinoplanes sp. L3-i22]BCY11689.1 serine hydrolase [Actinoplanes sp. L3-i22]